MGTLDLKILYHRAFCFSIAPNLDIESIPIYPQLRGYRKRTNDKDIKGRFIIDREVMDRLLPAIEKLIIEYRDKIKEL